MEENCDACDRIKKTDPNYESAMKAVNKVGCSKENEQLTQCLQKNKNHWQSCQKEVGNLQNCVAGSKFGKMAN